MMIRGLFFILAGDFGVSGWPCQHDMRLRRPPQPRQRRRVFYFPNQTKDSSAKRDNESFSDPFFVGPCSVSTWAKMALILDKVDRCTLVLSYIFIGSCSKHGQKISVEDGAAAGKKKSQDKQEAQVE